MRPVARSASCETSTRGPRPMPVARRSGSETSLARISKRAAPRSNASPIFRPSRSSSASSTAGAVAILAPRQRRPRRHRGFENSLAEPRPGAVDRLDLDERRFARVVARHRAHRGDGREFAATLQERAFLGSEFAVDQRKRGVAAQNRAAVARQSVVERARERIDRDDRRHAQRDADQDNAQPRDPAAQIAKGEAREGEAREAPRRRRMRLAHAPAGASASRIPERMRSVLSQRAARAGS